ncbi:MAG: DUF3110 domain-containing protein [Chloroflexaceae bacterium]|nr:DUF3110 domain-containing protein [Chloroflexaceae bacterium]
MRVYVLLFNARSENEGIHTVQVGDRNIILMFESEDDATRYALMLEAQDFSLPAVEALDSEEIEEFCQSSDYEWQLVPEGAELLAVPPPVNRDKTDWSPETKPAEAALPEDPLESIRRQLEKLL